MISQQQILIDFSYTDTIPNYTKNPMTESKKFCMKGLTVLKNELLPIRETEGSINFHDKISEMIQEEGYPMTESKKFGMKGLTVLKNELLPIRETEGSINFHDKISEMIQEEGYPMTESKKFGMKGLTVLKNLLQPIRETEGSINFHDKISEMIQEEGYPMTESKKFGMKGLQNPRINLSEPGLKILDRCYTPKKVKVISSDIATKSKYGIFPSLICCKFLIKHNFLSFLFTNNKNFKK